MKRDALHKLSQHSPVSRQCKAKPGDPEDDGQFGQAVQCERNLHSRNTAMQK